MADFEPRFYASEDGQKLPSVTSITSCASKPALYYFYGKHGTERAKQISAEASAIGTGVHEYIVDDLRKGGKTGRVASKFSNAINNYKTFKKSFKFEPIKIEETVFNLQDGYAGTYDLLANVEGKLVLMDWKTSKAIYPDYKLQLEAYWMCECLNKTIIDEMWIVRLDKEKPFNAKRDVLCFTAKATRYQAFVGLLNYFKWSFVSKGE